MAQNAGFVADAREGHGGRGASRCARCWRAAREPPPQWVCLG